MDEPLKGFRRVAAWFGGGFRMQERSGRERIISGCTGLGATAGTLLGMGVGILRMTAHEAEMLMGILGLVEFCLWTGVGLGLGSGGGALLGVWLAGGTEALRRALAWAGGGALGGTLLGLLPFLGDPALADDFSVWILGGAGAFAGFLAGAHYAARREAARIEGW